MDRAYWDDIAPKYDELVFDVRRNDRKHLILDALRQTASGKKTVIDAGCAVGKWLPALARQFRTVHALDISARNIAVARERNAAFSNISYLQRDMSRTAVRLPKVNVALCVNAVLAPSARIADIFLRNLARCLVRGGELILVVPSLESTLYCGILAARWNLNDGNRKRISGVAAGKKLRALREGVADIVNVPHKHFLREELTLRLTESGFKVRSIGKIEHRWDTAFFDPPARLTGPGPWHWLALAHRR